MGKRTAQKDTIIDITSDSQVNSNFPYRWSPAGLTFNNYFYLFLYLYITWITINNNAPHLKSPKNQNRRAALGRPAIKITGGLQLRPISISENQLARSNVVCLQQLSLVYKMKLYAWTIRKTDREVSFPKCPGRSLHFIKYSRLSLSRNQRDHHKHFEISVLRHNRFVILRKKQFERPNFTNDYVIWLL